MFFIELMASRFDIFGEQDLEAADPAMDLFRKPTAGGNASDEEAPYQDSKWQASPNLHTLILKRVRTLAK
jgi:zinc transporter 1/2/3